MAADLAQADIRDERDSSPVGIDVQHDSGHTGRKRGGQRVEQSVIQSKALLQLFLTAINLRQSVPLALFMSSQT